MKLQKFIPMVKVDDRLHRVYGLATAEAPDSDGEICDYPSAKKNITKWSQEAYQSTTAAGQDPSYGNIRLQHAMTVAGKVAVPPTFEEEMKQIWIDTEPKSEEIYKDLKRGFLRGFSIGGDYEWRRCNDCGTDIAKGRQCPKCRKKVLVRFSPIFSEISYVDSPCLKQATFSVVKSDGSVEERHFADRRDTFLHKLEELGEMLKGDAQSLADFVGGGEPMEKSLEELAKDSAGIKFTVGFPKGGGGSEVQSVLFDKKLWTKPDAKEWLHQHDFTGDTADESEDMLHYRQHDPGKYDRIRTITPGEKKEGVTMPQEVEKSEPVAAPAADPVVVSPETFKAIEDSLVKRILDRLRKPVEKTHPIGKDPEEASAEAEQASQDAESGGSYKDHLAAAWEHQDAAGVHDKAGNKDRADYHRGKAAGHYAAVTAARKKGDVEPAPASEPATKAVKYLVTEDDGTTHLPYTDAGGKPDHTLMGAAWAALHSGYRGSKYAGPNKSEAISHLKSIYSSEKMDTPAQKVVKDLEALLQKAAEEKGLTKSMESIGQLASILTQLAGVQADAQFEAEYEGGEGDPRDQKIADAIGAEIEALIGILKEVVDEETSEISSPSAAVSQPNAGQSTAKGANNMTEQETALAKARKSVAEHLGKLKEAVKAHADGMCKLHKAFHDNVAEVHKAHLDKVFGLHKAHSAAMEEGLGKLHKILGAEETDKDEGSDSGQNEPEPINPEAEGTKNEFKAAVKDSFYTKAQIDEMLQKNTEETVVAVIREMLKADDEGEGKEGKCPECGKPEEKCACKAKKTAGVGNRNDPSLFAKSSGPYVRVMPVTKVQDGVAEPQAASVQVTAGDVHKALAGDPEAALRVMKGTRKTDSIPLTVSSAVSSISK